VTVDGTDFRIREPIPFDRKWYSHKFNGPGVRYEVAICIQTGWIVWIHGPFPAGKSDIQIARNRLIYKVEEGEMFLADGGYSDGRQFFETPNGLNNEDQHMKAHARARHETVNCLFKKWGILSQIYRHSLDKHKTVFKALTNIIQTSIAAGEIPVYQVEYNDLG
jgi:hypothetical protein